MTMTSSLSVQLDQNEAHRQFVGHDFFAQIGSAPLTRKNVAMFIGQWWHPLHYFPTFLGRCVAVLPDIASKSAIATILNQETGGGDVARAHEVIYTDSMQKAGFDTDSVEGAAPFTETAELVAGYERGSQTWQAALGSIFATEVTDLLMVSSIGTAVERGTGATDLEWVRIHVEQEPDHVAEANHSLLGPLGPADEAAVLRSAEDMWRLWGHFFDRLAREIGLAPSATGVRQD